MPNRVGARKYPYFTPLLMLNLSEVLPSYCTIPITAPVSCPVVQHHSPCTGWGIGVSEAHHQPIVLYCHSVVLPLILLLLLPFIFPKAVSSFC